MWVKISSTGAVNLDRVDMIEIEKDTIQGDAVRYYFRADDSILQPGIPEEIKGMLGIPLKPREEIPK